MLQFFHFLRYIYIAILVTRSFHIILGIFTLLVSNIAYSQIVVLESEDFRLHYPEADSAAVRSVDSLLGVSLQQLQEELNYYTNRSLDVFLYREIYKSSAIIDPTLDTKEGVIRLSPILVQISLDTDLHTLRSSFRSQVAQILVEEMLFGGSLQDKIKSANLVNLPNWVLPGLYHYLGSRWSIYDDNSWRSVYEQYGFTDFNAIPPTFDVIKGASFWKFVEHKYGPSGISSLLYMLRLTRKMNSALYYAFQEGMHDVYLGWEEYFGNTYQQDQKRLSPLDGIRLDTKKVKGISVVSDTLFYTLEQSFLGYALYMYSGGNFTRQKLAGPKELSPSTIIPYSIHASEEKVQWLVQAENVVSRIQYSLTSGNIIHKPVTVLSHISQAKIIGNDLYILSSSWDNSYIYKSSLPSDTLYSVAGYISSFDILDKSIVATVQNGHSFELHVKNADNQNRKVLSVNYALQDLVLVDDSTVLLNAGVDGILNGKVLNLRSRQLSSVTNYRYNITSHQYDQNIFAEYIDKGSYSELFITDYLPVHKLYIYDTIYPTSHFYTQGVVSTDKKQQIREDLPDSLSSYTFQSPINPILDYKNVSGDSFTSGVSNFGVHQAEIWQDAAELSFSKAYLRLSNNGMYLDQSKFIDATTLQTPNRLNIDLGFAFANKLNTRSLSLGASGLLQSGALDIYASYYKQKRWLTQLNLLNRQRIKFASLERTRFVNTIGEVSFSKGLALDGVKIGHSYAIRHDQRSILVTNLESLAQVVSTREGFMLTPAVFVSLQKIQNANRIEASAQLSSSYDFLSQGFNISSEAKVIYQQRINPFLVLKSNASFNNSFGSSPEFYLLGGTASDVGSQYFQRNYADYKEPMLYHNLFGVRGFPLNYRNGNTAALGSIQLDWAIVQSVFNRPVVSDFFSNINLRTFVDASTSFYGSNIFDNVNVLNRSIVSTETGSIIVNVNGFKNPFLGSFGVGLGSQIFGYTVSLDAALGYESQVFNEPMLHLNIGHQF